MAPIRWLLGLEVKSHEGILEVLARVFELISHTVEVVPKPSFPMTWYLEARITHMLTGYYRLLNTSRCSSSNKTESSTTWQPDVGNYSGANGALRTEFFAHLRIEPMLFERSERNEERIEV